MEEFCGKCGEFCGKYGAKQNVSRAGSRWVRRGVVLAALIIVILLAGVLFGSGSIQRMISGGNLLTPSQATSTVTTPSASTSQVTAETSTLASSMASTSASTSTVPPLYHMPPSTFLSAPPLPKALGCYHYTQTGWVNMTCSRRQDALKQSDSPLPPTSQTSGHKTQTSQTFVDNTQANQYQSDAGGYFWGINSNTPTMLTYSVLMVNFHDYGGESDSKCGAGDYSLQLNTNYFTGNNGHQDWVQFTYQDYPSGSVLSHCAAAGAGLLGGKNQICMQEIDTDTNDYSQTYCHNTAEHGLWQYYEVIIEGFVVKENSIVCFLGPANACSSTVLFMYAFVNGDYWGIAAPDAYGLEGEWTQSTGGIMGAGASSSATWNPGTNLQTDIGVSSCPTPQHGQLFMDCNGPAISATLGTGGTGESSSMWQLHPLLTSYYRDTHWWLSSISNSDCGPMDQLGSCITQFVNYGAAFGFGNAMTYTVEDHLSWGAVTAGGTASTQVNVTSVDGVVAGPITMSVEGMNQGGRLGTEDLTGRQCTPGTSTPDYPFPYVQPGSNCMLPLYVSTSSTATPGIYDLTIKGSLPPNAPSNPPGFLFSNAISPSKDSTGYQLMIEVAPPPTPVIHLPTSGEKFYAKQPVTLVGYATTSIPGQLGGSFVSCSQLQFQAPGQMPVTPVPDPSYQTTGWCDAQMTFTVTGPVSITLSASNAQGVAGSPGSVSVSINISSSLLCPPSLCSSGTTPFTFQLSAAPPSVGVMLGGAPEQFTVSILCTNGCGSPQPVQLSVLGSLCMPGVTPPANCKLQYTLSTTSATLTGKPPSAAVTLTVTAPTGTAPGTYTLRVTGSAGGNTSTCSVQVTVETLG